VTSVAESSLYCQTDFVVSSYNQVRFLMIHKRSNKQHADGYIFKIWK